METCSPQVALGASTDMDPPRVFTRRYDEESQKWYVDINKELTEKQRKAFSLRVPLSALV